LSGAPPAGTYPGNLSLPVEVREKILSTFRHTLDLYKDGKLDDCLIGCDFILKMDPRFAPARKLQEIARNPKADVNVEELRSVLASAAAAAPPRRDTATVAVPASEPQPSPAAAPDRAQIESEAPVRPTAPRSTEPTSIGGLEALSLDSLSLDGAPSDLAEPASSSDPGLPFDAGFGRTFESPSSADLSGGVADLGPVDLPAASTEQEIAALLRQGDQARAGGDQQQAIEIWSRIFLIDINNSDAVERIEETRREMAEESRRVAAALEHGQASFAKGDIDAARKQFDSVLPADEQPGRPIAPPPTAPPQPPPLPPHDLSAFAASSDVLAEEMDQSGPPGRRSWTAAPRPRPDTVESEAPSEAAPKRIGLRVSRRVAVLAAVVVALAAGAVFFVTRKPGKTEVARPESGASLERATAFFREGKIAETTAELRQIPRSHPDYARAQQLLASLGPQPDGAASAPAREARASPAPPSRSGDAVAHRADAERALAENRYIDAMKEFSLAEPAFRGDPTFAQEMAVASEKVSELTPAVKLYNDGEYETAIPILWRIYQASRDNQDARSYLLRSYFNQGIAQLQNGLYDKAKESFGEALALDPQDVEAARHRQFSERYKTGDLDLLGRIYVRYVSPRP
jgi:tetratricopeptide (TPR) repeat protein